MSDWQPGDLALGIMCRRGQRRWGVKPGHRRPRPGGIYTVEGLAIDGSGNLGLILVGHHSACPIAPAFMASSFVKITPRQADEFDREVIELMSGKPVPVPTEAT